MPNKQILDERIRIILVDRTDIIEQKMFGGVGFLVNGRIACGALNPDLIFRVGFDEYNDASSQAFVKLPLAPGDKTMTGLVSVIKEGLETDQTTAASGQKRIQIQTVAYQEAMIPFIRLNNILTRFILR